MNVFFQQRRRLRNVVEYIGRAVGAGAPDAELGLRRLADVACWSPEHLDRAYRRARGESPMATVRRLRLKRAAAALRERQPLAEVADEAGYTSVQAFGRAFRREFGAPPLRWLRETAPAAREPRFDVVQLAHALPCHALAFSGAPNDVSQLFDEMLLRLQRSGSPRAQWQVFGVTRPGESLGAWDREGGRVELTAATLALPLSNAPAGTAAWQMPAGDYARIALADAALPWTALLRDGGWDRTEGPVLRHYDTDPAYTAPQERREWLYLPVARRNA
jgi:AraC-like DNA-binding protein